jgi:hypothetical protein
MPTLEETLKRLAITFTVKDIMIPSAALVCAGDESEAAKVSNGNPDFNVIPIKREGKLGGYFERDSHIAREITLNDLISDGTSLLDLVEILEERQFSFILSHRQIAGYAHFSDLNHHLVKLAFYVILEALERHVLSSIQGRDANDKEFLSKNLNPNRFPRISEQYKRDGDAARSLYNYLNISDILHLAVKTGKLQIDNDAIREAKQVRDAAAHALENIVADYEGVKRLGRVKRECLRILGGA